MKKSLLKLLAMRPSRPKTTLKSQLVLRLLGIAVVAWSAQVSAAGIGGINVISALGQPLSADIELVAVSQAEKSSLVARLASPEAYKAAGLDYPFGNKFKLVIENRAGGETYIHATSAQSINDPFVSLLVELSWSSGKLVREFTFLLDPVGYQAEQPTAQPVRTVAPLVETVAKPTAGAVSVQPAVEPVAAPPVASAAEVSTPVVKAVEQPVAEKPARKIPAPVAAKRGIAETVRTGGEVTVQRGDTLNKIAAANQTQGVSLERMLVALYRANVNQFDGKNMNRIQTGKILRLPDAGDLAGLTQADAKKEIHVQVSDWNAYRQQLASTAPLGTQQPAARQVSAGKINSTVTDKTPVAKESAKEVLKLSKGDALTDKAAATGSKATSQDKNNAIQEEAIAKAKAAEEERTRTALLEKNLQDIKHLAELKTQAAALAQAASAAKTADASPVSAISQVAASQIAAASAVSAASTIPPLAKPAPKPVAVEVSMMDQVLAEPVYLGGGAAVLLGLGGLAFAVSRRKNKQQDAGKDRVGDIGSVTGHIATPVIPSPETGDFTMQAGSAHTAAPSSSDDDPISEADLFLSFGRDAQAEEILQEALETSSNKTPIKMKLLEIYVARKDTTVFATTAAAMKDEVDDNTWQQVASLGRKVDPQNTLYGGTASVEDSDSATMQTLALSAAPELSTKTLTRSTDFDVSSPATMVEKTMIFSADELAPEKNAVMDFDVTATNPSLAAPVAMDFDVTANHAKNGNDAKQAESLSGLDDLVFDVTSTHPSMPAAAPETVAATKHDDDGMFTLDFPIESGVPKADAAAKPVEFDLTDINLNLGDDTSATKPVAESAQWHEVATKLDLARAYQEMGDDGGAREILDEVLHEGDAGQRAAAQEILKQLG